MPPTIYQIHAAPTTILAPPSSVPVLLVCPTQISIQNHADFHTKPRICEEAIFVRVLDNSLQISMWISFRQVICDFFYLTQWIELWSIQLLNVQGRGIFRISTLNITLWSRRVSWTSIFFWTALYRSQCRTILGNLYVNFLMSPNELNHSPSIH